MGKKDEKYEDLLLGGILRFGYETLKENLKNPKNESIFDFLESLGEGARTSLEKDPNLKNLYLGADIVKIGTEFWNRIKNAFKD